MRSLFQHTISPLSVAAIVVVASVGHITTLGAQEGQPGGDSLKWGPAPAIFPAGAKMAVERGDPSQPGEFIVRLSFPDGYRIPAHFHPTAEHVRVRSGTFLVGMGDTLDTSQTKPMAVGDSATIPAQMHHFAVARGATMVSVRARGPFKMTYVNPADTPKAP